MNWSDFVWDLGDGLNYVNNFWVLIFSIVYYFTSTSDTIVKRGQVYS
jgi:hypothetical protein